MTNGIEGIKKEEEMKRKDWKRWKKETKRRKDLKGKQK